MRGIVAGVIAGVLSAGIAVPARAAGVTANDPGFAAQWGVRNARVDQAWSTGRGTGRIVVAVVDTGVTPIADLAGRVLPGHDFVNGDDDARDDNGHGTMAAEVIAAAGDNATGVAGICWSCRILPVKVLDAKGGGGYDRIAAGIRYAADRGAQVISLSLGGSDDSDLLRGAVAYAKEKGSLVIAAAGNSGSSAPHYPAAIPSVLAVGAVTDTGARYPWSNYGSDWVDITAPGCNAAQNLSGVVTQYCGTSSATPFVAGVAGLLASTDPAPDADEIRAALIASRSLPAGRVDAVNALLALPYAGDTTRPGLVLGGTPALARGTLPVWGSATDQHGVARVELWIGGRLAGTDTSAPYSFGWATPAGTTARTVELRAYDRAGNVTATSRVVRSDNDAPALAVSAAPGVLTARAADASGVARLEVVVGGKVVGSYAGATWSVRTGVAHLAIRAYDRAGNVRVWAR